MKRGLPALALVAALSACGSDGGLDGVEVSSDSMGEEWPLTVDGGTLSCIGSNEIGMVVFTADDGTAYAVNGLAKGTDQYEDIMAIWADNSKLDELKVDMSPLTEQGLGLCE